MSYLVLALDPYVERTLVFDTITPGEVARAREVRIDRSGAGYNVARILGQFGAQVTTMSLTVESEGDDDDFGSLRKVPLLEPGTITTAVDRSAGTFTSFETRAPALVGVRAETGLAALLSAMVEALADQTCQAVILAGDRHSPFGTSVVAAVIDRLQSTAVPLHRISGITVDPLVYYQGTPHEELVYGSVTGPLRWKSEEFEVIPINPINRQGFLEASFVGVLLGLEDGCSMVEALERGNAAMAMNNSTLQPGSVRPV